MKVPRVFKPLLKPSRYKGAYGGRGSGKSHLFSENVVRRCLQSPKQRIVCIREVQKSLKDSAKRLLEDKIEAFGLGSQFRVLNDQIVTPGGGVILFQGMQDHTAETIKSLEGFDVAWVEEAQTLSEFSLEILRPTIRKQGSELWFSWNPRTANDPVDVLFRGKTPPEDMALVEANWRDNPFFPEVLEQERLHDLHHNKLRYSHIWEGDYEPMAVGAIWDRATIQQWRRKEAPAMVKIVVGIDPAVSSDKDSNETGIIVCGLGRDGRGYVLEDCSLSGPPHQWAARAIAAMDLWDADGIVVERNQGGDMIETTLRAHRPDVSILDQIFATRRKPERAKPISALYYTGKISHVGTFPELEDQMCKMTSVDYEGEGSPDRVDAMVYALRYLFPNLVQMETKEVHVETIDYDGGWMG